MEAMDMRHVEGERLLMMAMMMMMSSTRTLPLVVTIGWLSVDGRR
jgi:hypothetical protein